MRFPIAYYLLLIYITVMFRPLVPIVSDVVSHTFSEAIHIATVHAIYGTNHLEKELSNTTSDNTDNKHQSNINPEDLVPVHVSTNVCMFEFCCNKETTGYSSLRLNRVIPGFISRNYPPPKFSC